MNRASRNGTVTANGQSSPAVAEIRDFVAFWRGVVEKVPGD